MTSNNNNQQEWIDYLSTTTTPSNQQQPQQKQHNSLNSSQTFSNNHHTSSVFVSIGNTTNINRSSLNGCTTQQNASKSSSSTTRNIMEKLFRIFPVGKSLRFKTIIILTLLFLFMMAICLAILLAAFSAVFESVEYQQAKESSRRVSRALFDDFSQLTAKLFEYGAFDQTSDLMDGDLSQPSIQNYIDSNLNCQYMFNSKVNMIFLYHMNGSLITAHHCFQNVPIEGLPNELTELNLESNHKIRNFFFNNIENVWTRNVGILNMKDNVIDFATSETSQLAMKNFTKSFTNLLLVSGMPIQNSAYDYPRGLMIFGRYEMQEYILDRADRTQLCLTVFDLKKNESSEGGIGSSELRSSIGDYQYSKLIQSSNEWRWTNITSVTSVTEWIDNDSSLVSFLDSNNANLIQNRQCWSSKQASDQRVSFSAGSKTDRMASYHAFYSITGDRSMVIRSDIPRSTYQIGMASFLVVWSVMTFLIIVMSLSIVVFVELIILRRIIKFSLHVEKINENSLARVPRLGGDELGLLSRDVNIMLEEIERTQDQMKQDSLLIQDLLEKTALEEEKSRCVMNSIDDFIVTVECKSGQIVNINHSFESRVLQKKRDSNNSVQQSQQNDNPMMMGLNNSSSQTIFNYIKDFGTLEELLEKLDSMCRDQSSSYETTLKSGFGKSVPVSISVNKVKMIMRGSFKVDAFVIVAKNLSEQQEMKQHLKKQQDKLNEMKQNSEFERVMSDKDLRHEFKEFCRNERAEENIIFLEKVMEYKKLLKSHERAKKQKEIVETFLADNCPMPINISHKVLGKDVKKIFEGYGQVDLFDKLEGVVKNMIIADKFKRFFAILQQKQMELSDSISRSSMDRTSSSSSDSSYQSALSTSSGNHKIIL